MHAVADPRDDAAGDEHGDVGAAGEEHRAAAEALANEKDENGAEHTADVVEGRDVALHGWVWLIEVAAKVILIPAPMMPDSTP